MIERNPVIEDPIGEMDDFQQIKGIGPSIAQALHANGIHRFSELADYTAEELVNLLSPKVGFMTIQRIERDDWLGQARALGSIQDEKSITNPDEKEPLSVASTPLSAPKTSNHIEQREASWREIADFFVSFGQALDSKGQMRLFTRVHHSQADRFEQWDGVEVGQLIKWMLTQANLPTPAMENEPAEPHNEVRLLSSSVMQLEEEAQIELSDLWVSQVESPSTVDGVPQNGLLRLESKITLTGPDALHMTHERIPYNIQVYLVNTETNQSKCASIFTGQLSPAELSYLVQQDFPTPKRGRYQVNVIGQLSLPGTDGAIRTLFSYLQGPVLRVGS